MTPLIIGNWLLLAFSVPVILFIVFYAPMVWRRPSKMGVAILGSKLAFLGISAIAILHNTFSDFPALAVLRLVVFILLFAYVIFDFIQLMRARAEARRVSRRTVAPASAIVEPQPDDKG